MDQSNTYKRIIYYINRIRSVGDYDFGLYGPTTLMDEPKLYVRHHICYSPKLASELAKVEAINSIKSNYFFLLRSKNYNLLSRVNREIVKGIRNLGHSVNLILNELDFLDLNESERHDYINKEKSIILNYLDIDISSIFFGNPVNFYVIGSNLICGCYNVSSIDHQANYYLINESDLLNISIKFETLDLGDKKAIEVVFHPYLWTNVKAGLVITKMDYYNFLQTAYNNNCDLN